MGALLSAFRAAGLEVTGLARQRRVQPRRLDDMHVLEKQDLHLYTLPTPKPSPTGRLGSKWARAPGGGGERDGSPPPHAPLLTIPSMSDIAASGRSEILPHGPQP